ncbi:MAG: hypothetical protein L3K04_05280 [Thermoplasmata archaeon]|nr:hypothetical protein [Thermoplasmata archaeon]
MNVTPTLSPTARIGAAEAYDPAAGRVILFGGCSATACPTNDTWAFAGSTWSNVSPGHSPPARWKSMMAFDPSAGAVVLFGGCSNTSCQLNDTWTFEAGSWTNVTHPGAPPGRSDGSLAYDANSSQLLLFGGCVNTNGPPGYRCADHSLWALNATFRWNPVPLTNGSAVPPPREQEIAATDPADGGIFAGAGQAFNVSIAQPEYWSDSWTYSGGVWTNHSSTAAPPSCCAASASWDNATQSVIEFGGEGHGPAFRSDGSTWSFSRDLWANVSPSVSPAARELASMTYDAADSELVLFGGENGTIADFGDTWVYRLAVFPSVSASPGPGGVDLGQVVTFTAPASAIQPNASYLWTHLPDCAALDLAVLHCRTAAYGTFDVQLNVSAPNGTSGESVPLLYQVLPAPGVGTFSTLPPLVDVGQNVTFSASAAGGTGSYSYTWSALPPGCNSVNDLVLSCIPTASGSFTPHLEVRDSNGATGNGTLPPVLVNPALVLAVLVNPTPTYIDTPFALSARAQGGSPPDEVAWSALPSGCRQINTTVVNCTEGSPTTVRLAVEVRDATGANVTRDINVSVLQHQGTQTNVSGAGNNPSFLAQYWEEIALGAAALVLLGAVLWQRRRRAGPPEAAESPSHSAIRARELPALPAGETPEPPAD